jgi:phytoene dehydrogenase-like protein
MIAESYASELRLLGGTIKTGHLVESLEDLPPADIVMLDVAPGAAAAIVGDRMPGRVSRAYRRYRHGPGAFKVEFAVEGTVPWLYEPAQRAGTVHVGGTYEEIASAERAVARGRMPDKPFVLVGQQALADPSRGTGDVQPLYTYAHVPSGYSGDATEAIIGQIEGLAPGFRERILSTAVRSTTDLARHNPNYVGGDIVTGANMARQLVFRPRVSLKPYDTGVPGVYLCSAATPPGAGAHGACGYQAASRALERL